MSPAATIGDVLDRVLSRRSGRSEARTLVGLIGRGIQASRTPSMHEREGARLGLDYAYVLIDFDELGLSDLDLPEVLAVAQSRGFAGLNVTHPFKQAVIPFLDALAPEARAIGAVNTIVYFDSRTTGHNTDSWGFAESFREGMPGVALESVVQFGAGGAGAAVAYALMELGAGSLSVIDSQHERASAFCAAMSDRFPGRLHHRTDLPAALRDATGVVNATPVGMAKYPGMPFPAELLRPNHWVAEIIYFPADTELLERARALGCRTLAGAGMAIYQAVRAFELFTGRAPDRSAMAAHFGTAA